jgi:hypothetical protein
MAPWGINSVLKYFKLLMSLKNVPTTKCHEECLTQSAHVFVVGRSKSRKRSLTILILDMWHLKSAQEKQNVNRAREFLRILCHYEFNSPFLNSLFKRK